MDEYLTQPGCIVYSLGSNGQYDFEEAILEASEALSSSLKADSKPGVPSFPGVLACLAACAQCDNCCSALILCAGHAMRGATSMTGQEGVG